MFQLLDSDKKLLMKSSNLWGAGLLFSTGVRWEGFMTRHGANFSKTCRKKSKTIIGGWRWSWRHFGRKLVICLRHAHYKPRPPAPPVTTTQSVIHGSVFPCSGLTGSSSCRSPDHFTPLPPPLLLPLLPSPLPTAQRCRSLPQDCSPPLLCTSHHHHLTPAETQTVGVSTFLWLSSDQKIKQSSSLTSDLWNDQTAVAVLIIVDLKMSCLFDRVLVFVPNHLRVRVTWRCKTGGKTFLCTWNLHFFHKFRYLLIPL